MLRARCARVHNRFHDTSTHLLEPVASDLFPLETHTCPFPPLLIFCTLCALLRVCVVDEQERPVSGVSTDIGSEFFEKHVIEVLCHEVREHAARRAVFDRDDAFIDHFLDFEIPHL